MQTLGQILRSARNSKKLTLREVAEKIGIDRSTIHKIEVGSTLDPGFSVIVNLCRVYEIEISMLYDK